MNLAPGSLTKKSLPDVFVEKIKILPTDETADKQTIEITLSLQTLGPAKDLYVVPYLIFVAFAHDNKSIQKMLKKEAIVKELIRTPSRNLSPPIIKRYVSPPTEKTNGKPVIKVVNKKTGSRLAKTTVTVTQTFSAESLENLYIYATVYARDIQSLSPSGVSRGVKAMKMCAPVVETIMIHGQVPLNTSIFTLEKDVPPYGLRGEVWGGPVHRTLVGNYSRLMAGPKHISGAHPFLNTNFISNQKVQDLRFYNDIAKLQFTASDNKSQVTSLRQRKDLEKAAKVVSTPGAVSDCTYSRTMENKLKISFALDFDRLVKENTRLGYFIKNKEALSSCFQIENIRLYRTRVYPNIQPNELTPGKMNICSTSATSTIGSEKLIGSLKDSTVKPITFAGNTSGVINFIATDDDMQNQHIGDFTYRVSIDMVDTTITAASQISRMLSFDLARYNEFLAGADSMGEKGFNIKERIKRNSPHLKAMNKQWERLINSYITAITFFFGNSAFRQFNSLTWRKNLITMVNPANGDLGTMMQVAELVNSFNTNLRGLFAPATTATSANKFNIDSKISAQNSSQRKIVLDHTFRSNYKRDAGAGTGTDYLDRTMLTEDPGNYTNITYERYFKRISNELVKYNVPRPNDPGVNKFGFLSPARLLAGGNAIETSTVRLATSSGNGILNAALSPNVNSMSFVPANNTEQVYNEEIINILGNGDIAMLSNAKPLAELLKDPKPLSQFTMTATAFLSTTNSFVKESTNKNTSISGSTALTLNISQPRKKQIRSSRASRFFVNRSATRFKRMPKFKPMPALMGSLAAESAAQQPTSVELNDSFGNSVNFNSIVEVQYFDGYTMSNGIINLNYPIWRTLRKDRILKFKQDKATVLCRILLTTTAMKMKNLYELPLYNNLFILGDTTAPSASEKLGASNWRHIYHAIRRQMKTEMKNVSLNIGGPESQIDGAYTKVLPALLHHISKDPHQNKPTSGIVSSDTQAPSGASKMGGNY